VSRLETVAAATAAAAAAPTSTSNYLSLEK